MLGVLGYLVEKAPLLLGYELHFVIEAVMFALIIYLFLQRRYKVKEESESLTESEVQELITSWKPQPLVPKTVVGEQTARHELVVDGANGRQITVNGVQYLSFVCGSVLGLHTHPEVINAATSCMDDYGVGSCGPRGFYGSLAPHENLESRAATFMNTDGSVLFSNNFANISSVIPALANCDDILIVDKAVTLAVQIGCKLSRANLNWFAHNDVKDLERVLQSFQEHFKAKRKRIWVVLEGIYKNTGDIAPLPAIMELKKNWPFRLMIDETVSFGVLGDSGRGISEHFNIDSKDIEIITAGIANSVGCSGGLAWGNKALVHHMRLNCSGYVFSCSLPPFVSAAASKAIDLIEGGTLQIPLKARLRQIYQAIPSIQGLKCTSKFPSPLIHLRLAEPSVSVETDKQVLQKIEAMLQQNNILVQSSNYSDMERFEPPPSIMVRVMAQHTEEDIVKCVDALRDATKSVLADQ